MKEKYNHNCVLVTGGAGYIGSHTCKALHQAGYIPIAYDSLVYGHEWAVKWGPLEIGDIADRKRLDDIIIKYKPIAVMHFAAFAYVGESIGKPLKYYRNNVAGSLTLLEAMLDFGIDRIVFSSSCATYGEPKVLPMPEDHPQEPINTYGATKLMVEKMLTDVNGAYGVRSMVLRYFNAAGADPEGDVGEVHDPETHLIPLVLAVASGKSRHISVFGADYDTPDGTCVRDYIHVTDLAKAHVLALQELAHRPGVTTYNLGNGQGFSVKQVIEMVEKVTGVVIPVRVGARRQGDPPILIGDAKKIVSELGWQPHFSGLQKIVETAWRWEQQRKP